jgi:DNA-binding response OmpR family regulator
VIDLDQGSGGGDALDPLAWDVARQQPLLVLVADDDPDIREALADVLVANDMQVVLAVDGQHALEHLAGGIAPCAILLDWMMPRVNGEAFLMARATSDVFSRIPVFVISATHVPVGDGRAQGYLSKPFGIAELLSLLRSVCGSQCPNSRLSTCLTSKNGA